jgi:hypothetical protein
MFRSTIVMSAAVALIAMMATSNAHALDGSVVYITNNTAHTLTMKTVVPCSGKKCKGKYLRTKYWEGGQKVSSVAPWSRVRLFKTNRDSGIKNGATYHFNTTVAAKGWKSTGTSFLMRLKLRGKWSSSSMYQGVTDSKNKSTFYGDRKKRTATWSMRKGATKKNLKVTYHAYFSGGDDNVEFIVRDPSLRHVWIGTAPTCKGRKSDCEALDMNYVKKSKTGDGNRCLNSGHKVLCTDRSMPKTNRTGDKVTTFNLLNWNIFARPFIATHDGQIERMAHIPRALAGLNKGHVDAVVFEEAFLTGDVPSGPNAHRNQFLRNLKRAGFGHWTGLTPAKGTEFINGGVFIASRWPIVKQRHTTYKDCKGSDCMAAKGVVYAKIKKAVAGKTEYYHVFGTHMQAWHTPKKRAIRIKQAHQMRKFISGMKLPKSAIVLMAGDMNEDLLHTLEWLGEAPACGAKKSDCKKNGMTYVKSNKRGNGKACVTGEKVLCKKKMIDFGTRAATYRGTEFAQKLIDAVGGELPKRIGNRKATSNPTDNELAGSDGAAGDHGCDNSYVKTGKCTCCHKEFLDYILFSKKHRRPTAASYQILRPRAERAFPACMSAPGQPYYVHSFSPFCKRTWKNLRNLSDHYPVLGRFDFSKSTKPKDLKTLSLYWSRLYKDNFSLTSSALLKKAMKGYESRPQVLVKSKPAKGTIPLKVYWSDTRKDGMTLASHRSERSAKAAGYNFVTIAGYIYRKPHPGAVALKQWYHKSRKDNFLTASSREEKSAKRHGYKYVRTEGYAYPLK